MAHPLSPSTVRAFLEAVAASDQVLSWREFRLAPLAATAILAAACGGTESGSAQHGEGACAGDDCAAECQDLVDNDADGFIDCDDEACAETDVCSGGVLYGIPQELDCDDGWDDDGDGRVDCADPDCACETGGTGGSGGTGGVPTGGVPTGGVPTGGVPTGGVPTGGVPTGGYGVGGAYAIPFGGYPMGATGGTLYGIPTGGFSGGGSPSGGAGTGGLGLGGADYAAPYETICDDGQDNDFDGALDCEDIDCCSDEVCAASPNCVAPAYAAPIEDCEVEGDEDGDGYADCADADCFDHVWCQADYAAPLYEYDCDDEQDNDGDQAVDCEDIDCNTAENCPQPLYAAPM
ncbi:MAG: hypothetical protein JW751_18195 [Polyangiaceae bacterium]|nr:hypothetical protein [Polyangiaceae bacterium]